MNWYGNCNYQTYRNHLDFFDFSQLNVSWSCMYSPVRDWGNSISESFKNSYYITVKWSSKVMSLSSKVLPAKITHCFCGWPSYSEIGCPQIHASAYENFLYHILSLFFDSNPLTQHKSSRRNCLKSVIRTVDEFVAFRGQVLSARDDFRTLTHAVARFWISVSLEAFWVVLGSFEQIYRPSIESRCLEHWSFHNILHQSQSIYCGLILYILKTELIFWTILNLKKTRKFGDIKHTVSVPVSWC